MTLDHSKFWFPGERRRKISDERKKDEARDATKRLTVVDRVLLVSNSHESPILLGKVVRNLRSVGKQPVDGGSEDDGDETFEQVKPLPTSSSSDSVHAKDSEGDESSESTRKSRGDEKVRDSLSHLGGLVEG